jgi:hypothetical protein
MAFGLLKNRFLFLIVRFIPLKVGQHLWPHNPSGGHKEEAEKKVLSIENHRKFIGEAIG